MTEKETFDNSLDEYMTFLLQQPPPSFTDLEKFKRTLIDKYHLTEKQGRQIDDKCIKIGINIPKKKITNEVITITVSEKMKTKTHEIQLMDVLNQFAQIVYEEKFKDVVNNTNTRARSNLFDKTIILELPKEYKHYDTRINYSECGCSICFSLINDEIKNRIKLLLRQLYAAINRVIDNKF